MNVSERKGLLIKKNSKLFLLALHMIFWKYSRNFGYKKETWNSSCLPVLIKYRAQPKPTQGWNDAVGSGAGCLPLKACKLFFVKVVWRLGVLSDSLLSLDDWAASQKYLLTSLALWGVSSLPPAEATISSASGTWRLCYYSLLFLKPT